MAHRSGKIDPTCASPSSPSPSQLRNEIGLHHDLSLFCSSSRCYSIIDPHSIDADYPPIPSYCLAHFSAFFSLKELGFQVHSKPNFERLILKFREDRFVHAMFSNCSTACSKHVCPSLRSFFLCFAHLVEPHRVHQFRATSASFD